MRTHQNSTNPVATWASTSARTLYTSSVSTGAAHRAASARHGAGCRVVLVAGCGSHHIARQIRALGHDVRLIPVSIGCRVGHRLKASGPAGLPLTEIGSVNRIAVGRHIIIDAQCNEVTATQFAVNGEIEQGQVARAFLQIQLGVSPARDWAAREPLGP
jgi:hypothetical protein